MKCQKTLTLSQLTLLISNITINTITSRSRNIIRFVFDLNQSYTEHTHKVTSTHIINISHIHNSIILYLGTFNDRTEYKHVLF